MGAMLAEYCEVIPRLGDGLWMVALSLFKALRFGQEAEFQGLIMECTSTRIGCFIFGT